jgi:phage tail-like protein
MSTYKGWLFLAGLTVALFWSGTAGATNFAILLSGSDGDQKIECDEVVVEDLVIDAADAEAPAGAEYRHKRPGPTRFPHICLKRGVSKYQDDLAGWWEEVSGQRFFRSRSGNVILFDDKGEARTVYTFSDCLPVAYRVTESVSADGTVTAVEEYEFSTQGLEIRRRGIGGGASAGKPNLGKIYLEDDAGERKTDNSVESWSGGEPALIQTWPFRNSRFHKDLPGDKLGTDVTLDLPDGQLSEPMCEWINETVNGKPWKRSMAIEETRPNGKPGRTFIYHDCFPTRYVFPQMKKGGGAVQTETLTVKIGRIEFKT